MILEIATWQDFVFTFGSVLFWTALIPMIRDKNKPPKIASLQTGSVLFVYAIAFFTLGLVLSAFTSVITAGLWITLLIQRIRSDQKGAGE